MLKRTLLFILISGLLIAYPYLVQAQGKNPKIIVKTSKGDIKVELYQDKAPVSVKNILSYIDENFYDGTIFHRVIKGFMIQGGGLNAEMQGKQTKPPIKNEAANGLKNTKGTLAMARTGVVDSATCQFFINLVDNAFLDHKDDTPEGFGYAIFGKVVEGMNVVDAISAAPTGTKGAFKDVPRETITITSIRRAQND